MKDFESLFRELKDKAQRGDPESGTVKMLAKGKHAIGKKLMMIANELELEDIYRYL